jgi:hypothetical protein
VSVMKSVLWWGGGWGRGGSSALPLKAEERQTWHIGCVEMDKGEGKPHKVAFSSRASVSLLHTLLHPPIGPTRRLVVNHIRDATRGGAPAMTGTPSNHRHTSVYVSKRLALKRQGWRGWGGRMRVPYLLYHHHIDCTRQVRLVR